MTNINTTRNNIIEYIDSKKLTIDSCVVFKNEDGTVLDKDFLPALYKDIGHGEYTRPGIALRDLLICKDDPNKSIFDHWGKLVEVEALADWLLSIKKKLDLDNLGVSFFKVENLNAIETIVEIINRELDVDGISDLLERLKGMEVGCYDIEASLVRNAERRAFEERNEQANSWEEEYLKALKDMNTYEVTYSRYIECPENGTDLETTTRVMKAHSKDEAKEIVKSFDNIALQESITVKLEG